jgi:NAD(P)-dependent dehydrogenase (short-subunit alcohol dehydrogenase family)
MSERWTTGDIPDLTGRVIIVTGANCGIGFETAREFARQGAQTILACRNPDKAQAALGRIQAEIPDARAEVIRLDLASLDSVHQFARDFRAAYDRLDVLVNNAGLGGIPYTATEDGFEMHFGTHHVGHFALTGLLMDLLLATPGSRVVTVSSAGHVLARMDFRNLVCRSADDYSLISAYGRSKLANLLFTYELQRRFEAIGAGAIAVAVHPGNAKTCLWRHVAERWPFKLLLPLLAKVQQSAAMGALPTLRAAVDPQVRGSEYYGPDGLMGMRGYPVAVRSSRASYSEADAQRLWRATEELTGIVFGPPEDWMPIASDSPLYGVGAHN